MRRIPTRRIVPHSEAAPPIEQLGIALEAAKGFADTVLMKPLGELGGILSDTIGFWRLKNQVRLLVKAKEWSEDKGVDPAKVLPDIFVPILEEGSKVENEQLSDMFAALLASHLDSKTQDRVHPSFPKVLSQLSPLDARAMVEFRKLASDKEYRKLGLRGSVLPIAFLARLMEVSETSAYLSSLNLHRLGIIQHIGYAPPAKHPWPTVFEDSSAHQEFRISEYGIAFCDACHRFEDDTMAYYPKHDSKQNQSRTQTEPSGGVSSVSS